MFPELNIPVAPPEVRDLNGQTHVKDLVRKKWLKLTPEEWVRQHILRFMVEKLDYPLALIRTESGVDGSLKRNMRTDILAYDREAKPLVLVECKAHSVKIEKEVLYQAIRYNEYLKTKCIVLSNGLVHYCFIKNEGTEKFEQAFAIPNFRELSV